MPTTRRRRQAVREPLSPALKHYLLTGKLGHPDPEHHGFGDGVLPVLTADP
jgi:hypothetical protein